jgi:hypothetical protein
VGWTMVFIGGEIETLGSAAPGYPSPPSPLVGPWGGVGQAEAWEDGMGERSRFLASGWWDGGRG